jgi:hypothetical protein
MRCCGFIGLFGFGVILFALAAPLRADNCGATAGATLGAGALQWRKWELPLTSTNDYFGSDGKGNPQRDLVLQVTFTQCVVPGLVQYQARGFWYGLAADGQTLDNHAFRVRMALPQGTWQWVLSCSMQSGAVHPLPDCSQDSGFLNRKGRFEIGPSPTNSTDNFLYKNGFLQKSGDNRYLIAGPATPNYKRFFWLGDTAWNANLLMTYGDWQAYINNRSSPTVGTGSQFSVVQMAIAPKKIGSMDRSLNPPFDPTGPNCSGDGPGPCFRWNPKFWKNVDDKIDYANQKGIVVLLASFIEPLSKSAMVGTSAVGTATGEAKIFAQSVAARYSGNFVIYSPGFDNTLQDNFSIIDAVGSVLGDNSPTWTPRQLVTNHSAGGSPVSYYSTYLQNQTWLSFELYQSGTPGANQSDELLQTTDRASSMATSLLGFIPTKPIINGEAVYPGQQSLNDWLPNHTPYRARQTAYYSMLSGAMGYTMGTCGVVDWGVGGGLAGCNNSPAWNWLSQDPTLTAKTMKAMKSIFQSIYWESLRPEPSRIQLLTNPNQPAFTADTKSVLAFDGKGAILAYLPSENTGIRISFNASAAHVVPVLAPVPYLANANSWPSNWAYSWVSPRNGMPKPPSLPVPAPARFQSGVFDFMRPGCDVPSPPSCDAVDWVLKLTDKAKALPGPDDAAAIQVSNEIGTFSNDVRIVTRMVDPAGNASNEIEIGGAGLTDLGPPMIAAEPAGNSLVVWTGDDDNGASVRGRILDSQGNLISDELLIASGDAANPGHPSVVTLASGAFMVTWSGFDPDGTGPWIRYQTFDRLGSALTLPAIAESCKPVAGDFPQATSLAPGGFAIAWEMSNGSGIHVLQFDSLGNPSEMDMAQTVGSFPVLETIDGSGSAPRVSYGLYGATGCVGASSLSAAASQISCAQ